MGTKVSVDEVLASDGLEPLKPIRARPPKVVEYVISDEGLPTDQLILEGVDLTDAPTFTISEFAKFFFGRSDQWVRWCERNNKFWLDGKKQGVGRTPKDARCYTLADVEKMAHALAQNGVLDGHELSNTLKVVLFEARVWGVIL